jgi:phenylacetate-CoA ligase
MSDVAKMTGSATDIRSRVAGMSWPAMPSARGAQLLSLLYQFERTQWWSAEGLLDHQLRQLQQLLQHAVVTVPYYRERLGATGFDPRQKLTLDAFRALPLLTRRDIQNAGTTLHSPALPAAYGRVGETQTSGSTGEPVKVRRTQIDQLLWEAITLRDHHWHQRDFSGKLAVIRATGGDAKPPHGSLLGSWGAPASELYKTGPLAKLNSAVDVATQARWLLKQNPDYLLTYPSIVKSLAAWFSSHGERPSRLREVRTLGETVDPSLRAACHDVLGISIVDGYSSQELGYMALQCPVSGAFHIMAESVLVEIINDSGEPCAPGEVGQVVVTGLHNAAMPLVRYALGDHAEAGMPCACGRGLPTIARILGRIRNLLTLPSGERVRLALVDEFKAFAMVRQYQVIQRTLHDIEARLVVDTPLSAEVETRLRLALQNMMGYPFHISFIYFSGELPRGAGSKFEEFVSRLPS